MLQTPREQFNNKWIQLDEFLARRQEKGETAMTYIQDMQIKANKLKKNKKETMEIIIRAFRPKIRQFVLNKEPKTLDETKEYAKQAEGILPITKDNLEKTTSKVHLRTFRRTETRSNNGLFEGRFCR